MKALIIILSFSLTCYASDVLESAELALDKAKSLAGERDDMGKRAQVLYDMYEDSDKNFVFALSISHLTLGIERSSYSTPRANRIFNALGLDSIKDDMRTWGQGLRQLNKYMFTRLAFTYYWGKKLRNIGLQIPRYNPFIAGSELASFYRDTLYIHSTINDIHEAIGESRSIGAEQADTHVKTLIEWEHGIILQRPLEELFENLDSLFSYSLRHVPYRILEKSIITPVTGLRTTMSLDCFKSKTYLRTGDFLDANERMKQAYAFYELLKEINFDPQNQCFSDSYYLTNLKL